MTGNSERANDNFTPSLRAKSNAADNADVILWSDPTTHRLLVDASVSITLTTDNSAFTAGTSGGTPAFGFYHSTIDTVTDGRAAALAIDSKRNLFVVVRDAAGNARGLNVDASGGIAIAANSSVNVAQINGVTALMGNGVTGTGSLRVTIASDNTAFSVNATLSAETTKVIGVTRSADGSGNLLSSTGNALDINIKTIAAALTLATVTTVGTVTNLAQMNGVAITMGNGVAGTGVQRVAIASDNTVLPGVGAGATGSAVPANAAYKGLIAKTANPAAATDANLVGAMGDKLGRQVVVIGNVRDMKGNQITTITASTSETTVVTAVASTFLDVYGVIVVNSSATAANVSFKDSTAGTTQFNIYVPAGETRGFMLPSSDAFKQTTVNNNWTATSSASVSSLIISVQYVKNI